MPDTPRRRRPSAGVLDPANGPRAPLQIVEGTVTAYLQVHRIVQPRSETEGPVGGDVVAPNPPAAEVREEVVAHVSSRELYVLRIVERPAGYRAPRSGRTAVPVGEDRRPVRSEEHTSELQSRQY